MSWPTSSPGPRRARCRPCGAAGARQGIHPAVLSDLGLRPAVDALVSRSAVPVIVDGGLDERAAPSVEATLYFTIAEALTNVVKYARASEAVVTVRQSDGHAQVEISDDGAGAPIPRAARAFAVSSIGSVRSAGTSTSTASPDRHPRVRRRAAGPASPHRRRDLRMLRRRPVPLRSVSVAPRASGRPLP